MTEAIRHDEVPALLDKAERYCSNHRYSRAQFEKYLLSEKVIDQPGNSIWIGNFDQEGRLQALAFCNKSPTKKSVPVLSSDFICLAEIQSFTPGFGKPLLEYALDSSKNFWLTQDWEGGDALETYYRQFPLSEVTVKGCSFNGKDVNFFFKASSPEDAAIFLDFLKASFGGSIT